MALKTEYIIQILKQGEGAQQATADFQKVEQGAARANTAVRDFSTQGATQIGQFSLKGSEAMRVLQNNVRLLAFTAFPQATAAVTTFGAAVNTVRSTAGAFGIPVSAAGVIVAGFTTTIWAGVEALRAYKAELHEIATAEALGKQNWSLQDSVRKQMEDLLKRGKITAQQEGGFMSELVSTMVKQDDAQVNQGLRALSAKLRRFTDQEIAAAKLKSAEAVQAPRVMEAQLRLEEAQIRASFQNRLISAEDYFQRLRDLAQRSAADQTMALVPGLTSPDANKRAGAAGGIALAQTELKMRLLAIDQEHVANSERLIAQGEKERELIEQQNALYSEAVVHRQELAFWSTEVGRIAEASSQQFAQGFSTAFLNFVSGVQSAEDAFKQFASTFLRQIADMILQTIIFNTLKKALGGGTDWGSLISSGAESYGDGGVIPRMMAAGGIAGVGMVSRPTYFRDFNAMAGERGSEWMTVLSRPKMMQFGGIEAAVGRAGGFGDLAITRAQDLSAHSTAGRSEVVIRLEPGLRGQIVQEAVGGARVVIVRDMGQDTDLSQATRRLVS